MDEEAIDTGALESGAPQEQASPGVESAGAGDGTPSFEGGVPMPKERPKSTGAVQDITNIAEEGGVGPQGPIKRILSYLMGADAADPQEIAARAKAADPSGRLPDSAKNVLAVEQAKRTEGDEAAWRVVQGHRVAFNAKQAFGFAALNGNGQKPPDLDAAVDAANKAQAHVLDGSEVRFTPMQGGVTATVISPEGKTQRYPMSVDQFKTYLNVGGEGQFDKLMQNGVPAAIQKIATGANSRLSQLQPMRPNRPPAQQAAAPAQAGAQPAAAPAPQPQADQSQPAAESGPGYSREMEARASRIFPWASQSQQREAWLSQQSAREDELENKLQVAQVGGGSRVEGARLRANAQVDTQAARGDSNLAVQKEKNVGWQYASEQKRLAAEARVKGEADKLASSNANQAQTRSLRVIQEKLRTLQTLTPQEQSIVDRFNTDANASAPALRGQPQQGAAPQQQAPQQAAKPQGPPPVPGAKFYKGSWYTKGPGGEAVPVQQ